MQHCGCGLCTVVPFDAALSLEALLDGGHFNPEKPDCGPFTLVVPQSGVLVTGLNRCTSVGT